MMPTAKNSGPNPSTARFGGVADSLDEAKAGVRAAALRWESCPP
jgi:hypothetical protein